MKNRKQVRDIKGLDWGEKIHDDEALPQFLKISFMLITVSIQFRSGLNFNQSNYHQLSVDAVASFYLPWISWDHLSFVNEPSAYVTKMSLYKELLIVLKKIKIIILL